MTVAVSLEPVGAKMSEWISPPPGGFTADDLDRIPDLPPHAELIDGNIVLVSPQASVHLLTMDILVNGLRRSAPPTVKIRREMTVTLGARQRPEPDVLVVRADGVSGRGQTTFRPKDVILVAEVVSPDSEIRDRERKPQLYARAGIPHFWRIETEGDQLAVYVYELDKATMTYALTGIHHDLLKLTVPFGIEIDLSEIDLL